MTTVNDDEHSALIIPDSMDALDALGALNYITCRLGRCVTAFTVSSGLWADLIQDVDNRKTEMWVSDDHRPSTCWGGSGCGESPFTA